MIVRAWTSSKLNARLLGHIHCFLDHRTLSPISIAERELYAARPRGSSNRLERDRPHQLLHDRSCSVWLERDQQVVGGPAVGCALADHRASQKDVVVDVDFKLASDQQAVASSC